MRDRSRLDQGPYFFGTLTCRLTVQTRQHNRELLTTVAGCELPRPAGLVLQYLGDLTQGVVTGKVAGAVVIGLEVIDVGKQQGQRRSAP